MQKKNFYYVLVFSANGPKYVTKVDNVHRTAEWNETETPLKMTKQQAEYMVLGLNINGHNSVLVCSNWEQEQPYNYSDYSLKFEKKEK